MARDKDTMLMVGLKVLTLMLMGGLLVPMVDPYQVLLKCSKSWRRRGPVLGRVVGDIERVLQNRGSEAEGRDIGAHLC